MLALKPNSYAFSFSWAPRRDKYEKKLLWFWVDIAYKGTHEEEESETLNRATDFGTSSSARIPLGLGTGTTAGGGAPPPAGSDDEDEGGEEDDDDDDQQESGDDSDEMSDDGRGRAKSKREPAKKKARFNKKASFGEELPEEVR